MLKPPSNQPPADRPPPDPLATRIKDRRIAKGLTIYELAERAGVTPGFISSIENGYRRPSSDVAMKIARALGDEEEMYRTLIKMRELKALPEAMDALGAIL